MRACVCVCVRVCVFVCVSVHVHACVCMCAYSVLYSEALIYMYMYILYLAENESLVDFTPYAFQPEATPTNGSHVLRFRSVPKFVPVTPSWSRGYLAIFVCVG